ncbi:MAG: UPF0149 family protein [Pseudomonadota bacterium]
MSTAENAYLAIERLLGGCGVDVSAAEADGRLLSLASMLGPQAVVVWVEQLISGADAVDANAVGQLKMLGVERIGVLEAGEGLPDLCLPDDEDDLRDRVQELALWAGGFLSGMGEAAALRGEAARDLVGAEPISELLADLSEISKASVKDDALDESNESAYAELVEFLRVAAQLAYDTLSPIRQLDDVTADQVH